MIAALFVQPNGVYSKVPSVDMWDETRDARNYNGPYPVVAHPPCQLWGNLASVNYKRWGGEHNRPGNDGGCFLSALTSVRKYGGVLEHPAKTRAFSYYGLPKPQKNSWTKSLCGGWVCCVWQSAYGHRANKATWLYYFGRFLPFELRWGRPVGTHQIGQQNRQGVRRLEPWRNKPSLSKTEANATPVEFRDELIRLAYYSNEEPK